MSWINMARRFVDPYYNARCELVEMYGVEEIEAKQGVTFMRWLSRRTTLSFSKAYLLAAWGVSNYGLGLWETLQIINLREARAAEMNVDVTTLFIGACMAKPMERRACQ